MLLKINMCLNISVHSANTNNNFKKIFNWVFDKLSQKSTEQTRIMVIQWQTNNTEVFPVVLQNYKTEARHRSKLDKVKTGLSS